MSVKMTAAVLSVMLCLAGCAAEQAQVADAPPAPVTDDELSYRHEPLLSESGVARAVFDAPDPGDSQQVPRAFENAPPMIPHNVDGLLPITATENTCADCHLPEGAADVGATPVPASHLHDLRRGNSLPGLAGANYNCTLCHAPQANMPDLVENSFAPHYRAQTLREKSNLLDILNEGVK